MCQVLLAPRNCWFSSDTYHVSGGFFFPYFSHFYHSPLYSFNIRKRFDPYRVTAVIQTHCVIAFFPDPRSGNSASGTPLCLHHLNFRKWLNRWCKIGSEEHNLLCWALSAIPIFIFWCCGTRSAPNLKVILQIYHLFPKVFTICYFQVMHNSMLKHKVLGPGNRGIE